MDIKLARLSTEDVRTLRTVLEEEIDRNCDEYPEISDSCRTIIEQILEQVPVLNKVVVSIEDLASEMIRRGLTPERVKADDIDGWSNTLVDILQDSLDLETKVRKAILARENKRRRT